MSEFEAASSRADADVTEDPELRAEPVDPALLARRRQLRSWVGRGMLTLACFTLGALLVRGAQHRFSHAAAQAPIQAPVAAAPVVTEVSPAPTAPDAAAVAPPPSSQSTEPAQLAEHAQQAEPARPTKPAARRVATQLKPPSRRPKPSAPVATAPKRKTVLMPIPF